MCCVLSVLYNIQYDANICAHLHVYTVDTYLYVLDGLLLPPIFVGSNGRVDQMDDTLSNYATGAEQRSNFKI